MNRNIFSLVFNKARNMLVVAPEIAKGAHKSSRSCKRSSMNKPSFTLQFVFAVGALAGLSNCVHAQDLGLPSGSILDINNGTGGNDASYSTANVFQTYTVTYTATASGANYLLFAFRQDPQYWTFGNVSMVQDGTTTNLLTDPTFTQGGSVSSQSGLQAPADWGIVYQTGTPPEAAGQWYAPGQAPGGASTTNVNEGTAGSWYDGAVGSFDGIYEGVDLTAGDQYTITFTALSNNVANVSGSADGGVELGVFAGQCVTLSAAAASCTPNNASFSVEATPSQTVNAGSTATNITSTDNAAGLASSPATLLPVFDGGTLVLDGTDLTSYNFSITNNNGTVDLAGQSATISNPITDNTPGTPGSLTIANSGSGGALTLTGVNTYTGSTTINSGAELDLSGAGSIASSSGLTDNGNFDISGASANASIANLGGNGTVNLGGNGLTITSGNSSNFSGTIYGAGGLTVAGGAQALSGTNTYTGATAINSGATLAVSGNGSISSSSSVNDNGTFDISGSNGDQSIVSLSGASTGTVNLGNHNLDLTGASGTFAGSIQGNGGLHVAGGTEALSGNNTYLGATTIDSGAELQLTGNGQLSSNALSSGVVDNGTFDISQANGTESVSTLSGSGSVTLGNNNLALTNASGNFSGIISGNGGVVIDYGPETLSGANTYAGGTDIQGGSLIVSADGNLGAANGALTFGNAVLENTASFTSTRNISIGSEATFNTDAGTTLTDTAGAITGGGAINKVGAGTLILGADDANGGVDVQQGTLQLTGASTYTGETNIMSGATLALTSNGSISNSWGVLDSGGTFDISGANSSQSIGTLYGSGTVNLGSNNLTFTSGETDFSGTIAGSGGIVMNGGQQTLSGTNTYTGGTTFNGGWLEVSGDANLGDAAGALTFNGGGLASTATFSSTRNINVNGGGAIFDVAGGTTLTDTAGTITGTGSITTVDTGTLVLGSDNSTGGVNVYGGTLQLTGVSSYTGTTYIDPGATLALTGNGSISDSSSVADNGMFDISGASGAQSITGLAGSGSVNLGNNGLTFTNASNVFGGSIGGNGGVTMSGGVEELSGSNSYSGGTTLSGGNLMVSGDANLGNTTGALNFDGGTLESTASFSSTRNINMTGAANFDVDGGTTLTDTAGTITGTGPINKEGTGTLVLGADTSTGGVNVGAGTLQLTGVSTDTGASNIAAGATLAIAGNGSDASASSINNSGTFDIGGANNPQSITSLAGNGTVALGNNGLTLTNASGIYSGTIGGNGGVTMSGGAEELSGTNTYSGGTTLNGGTLAVSSDSNLGSATGALNFNGGTLENTASFTTSRDINASGAVNIVTDAGTTLTDTAGTITGSGPINKGGSGTLVLGADNSTGGVNVGAGTLQLTGASTDTGATNVAAGATLAITGNGSDANASSINDGGTLDISGAHSSQSIGSLAGYGTVALGTNGLTLTNANGNFSGSIGGNGGVSMSGGTEVLSGANTYSGGTTLNGGNLVINSDANLGAAGTPVTFNGGTLTVTQSINTSRNLVINSGGADFNTLSGVTVQDSGAISGIGSLVKSGDGTLVVSGANTFSGGTLIDGGVVQIDTGSSLGTGTILLNGGTLQTTATLNNNQNVVVSGNAGVDVNAGTTTLMAGNVQEASGGGCFVKSGSGTLDFTGTEVLANGTCVQQGMLRANGALVSNVTVDAPGELRGVGVIEGPINVSGRLAPGNSPGTLTATGTVTMQAGSTYEEDIDGLGTGTGAGNYSRLLISGANNQFVANGTLMPLLRGITGNASNMYVPQIGDVYQFVVAQGGIVGQFSALTQPTGLAPNTRMVAFYNVDDNHAIELGVVPDSYASLIADSHANRNALSVAGALDQALDLQANGTASTGQSQLLLALAGARAGQLAGVLTNLSGEIYADAAAAARATGLAMQSDTLGHLMTDDSDVSGEQKGHTAWTNVSHTGNSWSGDAQGSAFQTGTNQTTAGTDLYAGNGTVVGVAASNHDNTVNAGAAQGTIRGYDGIVYGQQAVASVLLDGMVAQGHDTWITRRPDPTGVAGELYSRASGNNTMADLTARMPMTVGGLHVEPYASVTWQQFDRGGMSETANSPAALQVAHLSASGGRALLGLNIGSEQQDPLSSEMTYRVGAALGADSRGMLSPTVQSTIESETFQTKAPAIGSGFVQLQANATLRLSHDAYLYGGLTDENGARRSSYGVTAGLRVSF